METVPREWCVGEYSDSCLVCNADCEKDFSMVQGSEAVLCIKCTAVANIKGTYLKLYTRDSTTVQSHNLVKVFNEPDIRMRDTRGKLE